tara:strand:- start:78 stop:578 length:501 start_codon:yes stop_codon:yes gene_type:complete
MIIEFNNQHAGTYFVISVVSFLVIKNYIHGIFILPISLLIIITKELNVTFPELINYSKYTNIPTYAVVIINICVGLFLLYKSNIELPFKVVTIVPLITSVIFYYIRPYGELKYEYLQSAIARYIPTMLFAGFLIGVAFIPDNQEILHQEYANLKISLGIMENEREF